MLSESKILNLLCFSITALCIWWTIPSKAQYAARRALNDKTLQKILEDNDLRKIAVARGREIFSTETCHNCHGENGRGASSCPSLIDQFWIWPNDPDSLFTTIKYGIRNLGPNSRQSVMPRFADTLSSSDLDFLASFVIDILNGGAGSDRGRMLFASNCAVCHGSNGEGRSEIGAVAISSESWRSDHLNFLMQDPNDMKDFIAYGGWDETKVIGMHESRSQNWKLGRWRGMPGWGADPIWGYADYDLKSLVAYVTTIGGLDKDNRFKAE